MGQTRAKDCIQTAREDGGDSMRAHSSVHLPVLSHSVSAQSSRLARFVTPAGIRIANGIVGCPRGPGPWFEPAGACNPELADVLTGPFCAATVSHPLLRLQGWVAVVASQAFLVVVNEVGNAERGECFHGVDAEKGPGLFSCVVWTGKAHTQCAWTRRKGRVTVSLEPLIC